MQVMTCKNKGGTTAPHSTACTEGDILMDSDYVINQDQAKEDAKLVVPSTVYVEVMVAIDDDLYSKIGKSYKNGKWSNKTSYTFSFEFRSTFWPCPKLLSPILGILLFCINFVSSL